MIRNDNVFRPGKLGLGTRVKTLDGYEGTVTRLTHRGTRYVVTGQSLRGRCVHLGTFRASELLIP